MLCFCIFMTQIKPVINMKNILFFLLVGTLLLSCSNQGEKSPVKLFKQLESKSSAIDFSNNLIENDSKLFGFCLYLYGWWSFCRRYQQ